MKEVISPRVVLLAETHLTETGVDEFLVDLGVSDWETDAASDTEKLLEVAGKSCYLSFSTDLNKNLTRVGTRNNRDYLQEGIIKTGHGSVLEHGSVSLALVDVSRILTHELVRHRAGCAYSQVSGRYVRVDELKFFIPTCIRENLEGLALFISAVQQMEDNVRKLSEIYGIDDMGDFAKKKELTSAFRRIIGNGQANHIVLTANHRALRHMIEMRTSRHAEEEIRRVFAEIYRLVSDRYPAIYADAEVQEVAMIPEIIFNSHKI